MVVDLDAPLELVNLVVLEAVLRVVVLLVLTVVVVLDRHQVQVAEVNHLVVEEQTLDLDMDLDSPAAHFKAAVEVVETPILAAVVVEDTTAAEEALVDIEEITSTLDPAVAVDRDMFTLMHLTPHNKTAVLQE